MTVENRKAIAAEIATLLGVDVPVPESFEGLPTLNNQNSSFFAFAKRRETGSYDALAVGMKAFLEPQKIAQRG